MDFSYSKSLLIFGMSQFAFNNCNWMQLGKPASFIFVVLLCCESKCEGFVLSLQLELYKVSRDGLPNTTLMESLLLKFGYSFILNLLRIASPDFICLYDEWKFAHMRGYFNFRCLCCLCDYLLSRHLSIRCLNDLDCIALSQRTFFSSCNNIVMIIPSVFI